ncbi:MAG TPA: MBL fold metallo-hydrolase [Steroidobacteraceae bacterium]|jgi:cyclase|nr:MBL fold metallo-hydrolase [Steroidobacteraceae bacterium]
MSHELRERPRWSRRRVLQVASGAASLAAGHVLAQSAGPAPPRGGGFGAPPATIIHSELKQLSATTYAFLQREAPGQSNYSVSNFGIVVGPRSLLAIDAGGGPQHARNFIAAAKPFGKPFDRVVITHSHPDHIVGLTQFPADIEIVAQEATRAQMAAMGAMPTPAYWATNPAWGRPGDVNRVVLPTVSFHDRMSVFYGDTQVDFVWPGRAHTLGDVLVHVPKEKILFMGDIAFFGVTPLNGSGFIEDWIKVCDRTLADDGVETIVPGHGPVGGKAQLAEMRGYLELLWREGRKKFDAGVSAGRAAAEIDLGGYATWTDADRIAANVARLYAEFRGTLGSPAERDGLREAIAEYNQIKGSR